MGQMFGNLTQANLVPPTGSPQSMPSTAAAMDQANQALQQSGPALSGDVLNPTVNSGQNLPMVSPKPSFFQAASAVNPQTGMPVSPLQNPNLTKGGKLLGILGLGLQGAMAGLSAQSQGIAASGGHYNPGVGPSFEAGIQLPFLQALRTQAAQRGGLENQNLAAQTGETQARTGLYGTQQQTEQLNNWLLRNRIQQMSNVNGQGGGAPPFENMTPDEQDLLNGAYRQFQLSGDPSVIQAAMGKIYDARATSGRSGLSDVVPDSQSATGYSRAIYDKNGNVIKMSSGVLPPAGFVPKTTQTMQWKTDDNGIYRALPVTTTTTPRLPFLPQPGATPQAAPGAGSAAAPPGVPKNALPRGGMKGPQAGQTGLAYDPQSQQYTYTTRADAAGSGLVNFMPSTTKQFQDDVRLNNRLADVQQKLNVYHAAFSQPISTGDVAALSHIL